MSILFWRDCELARMIEGRGILLFSLWSTPPRLPRFLTTLGLNPQILLPSERACWRVSVRSTAVLSKTPMPKSRSNRRNSWLYWSDSGNSHRHPKKWHRSIRVRKNSFKPRWVIVASTTHVVTIRGTNRLIQQNNTHSHTAAECHHYQRHLPRT